jgi:hypothetical protein
MRALYQQRPFRYSFRGGYGKLEITFTPDRRVLQINSTCIPEIESLQRSGAGIRPKADAEKVISGLTGRNLSYQDSAGNTQTFTVAKGDEVTVRELVVYPTLRAGNTPILEFHLAWEIAVKRATDSLTIYLDAVTDELITVAPFSE